MDIKTLTSAVMEIAEERGISQKQVISVIETALASAYKKEYGKKREKYVAELNYKIGEVKFWQIKQIVSEKNILSNEKIEKLNEQGKKIPEDKIHFISERHILLKDAKKINPEAKVDEDLKIAVESKEEFGRIAAQTAKQIILQKIKEVEKEVTLKDFQEKKGELISGIVQRVEDKMVYLDIGKISGILPKSEQIPGEFYQIGRRLKLYVLEIEEGARDSMVILSRAYPKLISKLFELEVPEISADQIIIKSIAREAGSRSKIAVQAVEEGIDPIGALVGQRGIRIMTVINELGGEKIDVIKWSDKSEEYIANSLSPAKILEVKVLPKNKAEVYVDNNQLSLTIGKDGQNVRLAAKLTGWKIDVRSIIEEGKTETETETKTEMGTEMGTEIKTKTEES